MPASGCMLSSELLVISVSVLCPGVRRHPSSPCLDEPPAECNRLRSLVCIAGHTFPGGPACKHGQHMAHLRLTHMQMMSSPGNADTSLQVPEADLLDPQSAAGHMQAVLSKLPT